jgi:hypothetical protein
MMTGTIMDFLDPKKQKAHGRRLAIGYVLIGLLLLLATTILLYQAYGYGIDRHGRVIQNGLVFISSVPEGAEIYVDGTRKDTTNTRVTLPAGQYTFEIKREGYQTWQRAITVGGGTLQRFDYPFLFPSSLVTTTTKQYAAQPTLLSQSIDRRWLFAQNGGPDTFDLFDLKSDELIPQLFTVPSEILSAGTKTTGWQEVAWAKDNRHVVFRRLFDRAGQQTSEYILVDRADAAQSVNLSVLLGFTPTILQLRDGAHDQYYAFDQPNGALFTASLRQPTPQPYLSNVLAFQSEGDDTVLFATSQDAPPGRTLIRIRQGDDSYTIRQVASDAAPYLLELARFEDAWFVAAGASGEDKIYVYRNPVDRLKENDGVVVPRQILKVTAPNYISFAPDFRYVMVENNDSFATYDAKTDRVYAYKLNIPVDAGRGHASWMDGYRLAVVSAGQIVVFDYDGNNQQGLASANPAFLPYFDPVYRKLHSLTTTNALTSTALRTTEDQ